MNFGYNRVVSNIIPKVVVLMRYITRAMEETFLRLNKQFPAILITGPRQVGKTTMLQKLMQEENSARSYVTLDDLTERQLAKNDPALFFQLHKPPLLIDEVQYAPELFQYIKILVDTRQNPGDFWLTGSQIFKLMRGVRESMAGRVALLNMFSLSQQEILGNSTIPFKIDFNTFIEREKVIKPSGTPEIYERIFKGGMPALISGKYTDHRTLYSSYVSTYIDRDVKDISGTIDSLKFMNFITATAALAGQMLNYKTIAENSDIDQSTVKNWLNILEMLGIIFYLHPYSNNVLKRTVKTPKLYFYDTGLVCYLTKWSSADTLMSGAMSGAILENFAVSEILKSYYNSGIQPFVYYYRDKDTKEIDLIMEKDGSLFPIEIKKTATPDIRLTKVFDLIDRSPLQRGTGAILCTAEKLSAFNRDNLIVPIGII
jgi:predicted AAA+ superfamily ATPase